MSEPERGHQVKVERSRIALLTGSVSLLITLAVGARGRARAETPPEVAVYKPPT